MSLSELCQPSCRRLEDRVSRGRIEKYSNRLAKTSDSGLKRGQSARLSDLIALRLL